MSSNKKPSIKSRLHIRNRNREQYDLAALIESTPELRKYVILNRRGEDSVDFNQPRAVKLLNQAILDYYYGIKHWEFPDENLCPPIPGRADYIHHMADLLAKNHKEKIPKGETITCLDVGVGASCIYPIIGVTEYGWKFIGSDIDSDSIASSQQIVEANSLLKDKIECRLQTDSSSMFKGIINDKEKIDISICNPPFHASMDEAQKGSQRKVNNLSGKRVKQATLNFSGIQNELIYEGGENKFIQNMITESKQFAKRCCWFSTLVSKQSNLKGIYKTLELYEANLVKTIPLGTGNKSSRIVAWTFLTKHERKNWVASKTNSFKVYFK